MSLTPTIAPSMASSRLRASWSSPSHHAWCVSLASVAPMADSVLYVGVKSTGDIGHMGHMGTNFGGSTESKRLVPGSLDEVLT